MTNVKTITKNTTILTYFTFRSSHSKHVFFFNFNFNSLISSSIPFISWCILKSRSLYLWIVSSSSIHMKYLQFILSSCKRSNIYISLHGITSGLYLDIQKKFTNILPCNLDIHKIFYQDSLQSMM